MSDVFGYTILAETDMYYIKFPPILSDEPLTDDMIVAKINELRRKFDCSENPREIVNLVLICASVDDCIGFVEELDPYIFWLPFAEIKSARNKCKYRVRNGGEK